MAKDLAMSENTIIFKYYESPCGKLILGSIGEELCLCDWRGRKDRTAIEKRVTRLLDAELEEGSSNAIEAAAGQLDEYFRNERCAFDIPVRLAGTEFQLLVWQELQNIPYGTTASYSELANRIGKAAALRSVAAAIGANALSIFVPCHRVIGANGSLTGYAGGLEAKEYLLNQERQCRDKVVI